jgi:Helix-turn-helix family
MPCNAAIVNIARLMWTLYEPVHAVTYFAREARQSFEEAGLRGFWRGYFAGRAAPLGPVPAAPVIAAFFNFAPRMVARAIPDVWQRLPADDVLQVRAEGANAALARLTADQPAEAVAEAADLLEAVAMRLDHAGRVLGAANASLEPAPTPLDRLWQAATTLREHRGDGHVAALVATGLSGCEVLVWRAAYDLSRDALQPHRGWTDEEWAIAVARLIERGWLDATGRPTDTGVTMFREIEATTDRTAAEAWYEIDVERLRAVLTPIALACRSAMPEVTPIGLPEPGAVS